MIISSLAQSTGSIPRCQAKTGALSETAWERVLDRQRMKLPGKPSRSAVFGRAGLRYGKMYWLRKNPDLRSSVVVKLARALKMKPAAMFEMLVKESTTDPLGEIRF